MLPFNATFHYIPFSDKAAWRCMVLPLHPPLLVKDFLVVVQDKSDLAGNPQTDQQANHSERPQESPHSRASPPRSLKYNLLGTEYDI